jgi:DNA-binding SARP family transcriptional activator
MVHYMTGDFRSALDVCAAALPEIAPEDVDYDTVQLLSVRAAALFMVGEADESTSCAHDALTRADGSGDDRARAAANLGAALAATGERREAHLRRAHEAADRAGDVVALARILVNQADGLLEDARYGPALEVAVRALRAAQRGAPPGIVVTALYNVGEALTRLGRYDEAAFSFDASVRLSRRAGLRRTAPGLLGLGEVRRLLGRREQARMALEEAVEHARAAGEMQVLIPALAGLTRLLLDGGDADLVTAREAATDAEALAPADQLPAALVARGWVALAEGDLGVAQDRVQRAMTAARSGRSVPALAESLELAAAVSSDVDIARAHLHEALTLWTAAGAPPFVDRILVLLGRLPGAGGSDRVAAREAGQRLVALGVRAVAGEPALPADGVSSPLHVRVLGGFEVVAGGRPVKMTAWRSRQARTLVKMLVARRGRPIPRGEVCEILWPDDEPQRTAHRLSVLLSVVRGVLDASKAWDPDHYIRADAAGVSLDLTHVTVDALDLMRDAAHAEQLARSGDVARARELLLEVDTAYHGDAFDEEPYEEWAGPLREEARAAWTRSLRTSAELSLGLGEPEQAVTTLVRLLTADPLDESAHRQLVEVLVDSGRHGEARRAWERWAAAMRSIDAPEPSTSALRGPGGASL